jgi:hypothetical protein
LNLLEILKGVFITIIFSFIERIGTMVFHTLDKTLSIEG